MEGENRIEGETSSFSIYISPTSYGMDLSRAPYTLHLRYSDRSMQLMELSICELSITTDQGRTLHFSNGCEVFAFVTPGFIDGTEPYFKSATHSVSGLEPNFSADEKLIINFSYKTHAEGAGTSIELLFNPVLERGKTQPCCLPSV